ncbi:MAG TPA: IS200/IS605 family transposase [Phycisphaerae bacterium]|nr:IS200/IS605 family transposase [Phycisphaerae bacterium]
MSYMSLYYHIVFSTKERRSFLSDQLLPRVVKYIGGIIRQMDGQLLEGDGMPDHVHLAAIMHPTCSIADFLRTLKTNSTRWIHETFSDMATFAWQEGYAAFTVSPSALPAVKTYIRTQKEHHREISFVDELKALLDKHGIEYDERYLA